MEDTTMAIQWKKAGIGLVSGLAMLCMYSLVTENQSGPVYAQAQQTMTQAEWQALAQQVATTLDRLGIQMGAPPQTRAVYVPALTQEYLRVFQRLLMQGATKQQADLLASQHIGALIQQLVAGAGSAPGSGGGNRKREGILSTYDKTGTAVIGGDVLMK